MKVEKLGEWQRENYDRIVDQCKRFDGKLGAYEMNLLAKRIPTGCQSEELYSALIEFIGKDFICFVPDDYKNEKLLACFEEVSDAKSGGGFNSNYKNVKTIMVKGEELSYVPSLNVYCAHLDKSVINHLVEKPEYILELGTGNLINRYLRKDAFNVAKASMLKKSEEAISKGKVKEFNEKYTLSKFPVRLTLMDKAVKRLEKLEKKEERENITCQKLTEYVGIKFLEARNNLESGRFYKNYSQAKYLSEDIESFRMLSAEQMMNYILEERNSEEAKPFDVETIGVWWIASQLDSLKNMIRKTVKRYTAYGELEEYKIAKWAKDGTRKCIKKAYELYDEVKKQHKLETKLRANIENAEINI